MTQEELYWLAGLLEGEGYFALDNRPMKPAWSPRIRIRCQMVDEDIVKKIFSIVGFGNLYYKESKNKKWQPTWIWELNSKEKVAELCKMLFPLMGQRRKSKIVEMLNSTNGSA